ncbi:ParD-like family protein [Erwiniaceae bacterium BAC15a-03b]|uniref:ParD-like family protein n=1 Tax=Winslowiella arboricola TaxID=2978220 RepID=A0A9J6PWH8_9GAMM|nr:ParD-like family protein [Winslowiella arboricola]MCU5772265.1 ParD-like family protein [Winslowiella arboricola]MCU5779856.1 ParD-like family protein [Winslowiella arboricola]
MGIVKISDLMHENLRITSNAMSRSINSQAEHWLKIGMLAELYPQLTHHQLARALVKAEMQGGVDIVTILNAPEEAEVAC